MINVGKRVVTTVLTVVSLSYMPAQVPRLGPLFVNPAVASPTGDACRREICNAVVASCMRANLSLNPVVRTEDDKKAYCDQFYPGCMSRNIIPDLAWYSPETVSHFLKCPS
jgi:hypothetical protein